MARGAEGKLRRRNRKKEDAANADRIFAGTEEEEENGEHEFGAIPMPPGMSGGGPNVESDDDDSEEEDKKEEVAVPKKKKKKNKARATAADGADPTMQMPPQKKAGGIKSTPLILLILMVGTTVLPGLIYASDFIGNFLQKNHVLGQIGFRMGMGAVPRKRVLSFYEMHDPSKIEGVPDILSKYYGDYPKLVKNLERKYQDYGYFLGWEEDEAPLALAMEQVQETYNVWIHSYWNVYAPQTLKTAARNIRYNLAYLHKKMHKVFKKQIWPVLEPFLGVPKGAAKQKREDAQEGRKRKESTSGSSGSGGKRRRSAQFRDDVED
jgi:hypothetical protein